MSEPSHTLPASVLALARLQQRFVLAYLRLKCNGTAAAREAGYKGDADSLAVTASQLLRHPKVSRALADLTTQQLAPEIGSARWVLKRLEEEAGDPHNFPPNRTRALDLLGKYLGLQRDPTQTALLEVQIEERRAALQERKLALEERKVALAKARLELDELKRRAEGGGLPTAIRLAWVDEPKVDEDEGGAP